MKSAVEISCDSCYLFRIYRTTWPVSCGRPPELCWWVIDGVLLFG